MNEEEAGGGGGGRTMENKLAYFKHTLRTCIYVYIYTVRPRIKFKSVIFLIFQRTL